MCTGGRGTEHREEEILYFMDGLLHPRGFPCGLAGKESACNVRGLGSIPGLGRSPREGKGYPFQYSGLENSIDCIVHGVAKSRTRLSNFHVNVIQQCLVVFNVQVINFFIKTSLSLWGCSY